jgi:DNA-binding NtrC family response regulator
MSIRVNLSPSTAAVPCVLYVDDEPGNLQAFMAAFRRDFRVLLATTAQEAMDLLGRNEVHVVMADQRMPGTLGTELLRIVKEQYPRVRRMMVTAYSDVQAVIDAINQGGVMSYLYKPWHPEQVVTAVQKAFSEVRSERDKEEHVARLSEANAQLEFALRQALLS